MKYTVYGFPSRAKRKKRGELLEKIINKLIEDLKSFDEKS